MSSLTAIEKRQLEKLFQMWSWYVLDFSDRTMSEFFIDEMNLDIFEEQYEYGSNSKANRLRWFWRVADDKLVWESVLKMIKYIESNIALWDFDGALYPPHLLEACYKIRDRLTLWVMSMLIPSVSTDATIENWTISLNLNKEVFEHVASYLESGHYFNAVEESYKIVRAKLKKITGKEKAHEAFSEANMELIFGRDPVDDVEKDFFQWVKFLHMAIQMLRNEKSHTPAHEIDKNLAIHYIVLASLAYDLI